MVYFILLKGKKAKSWSGAIPATPKATRSSLESLIRRTLSQRYSAKIVTGAEFKALLKKGSLRLLKSVQKKKVSSRK